MKKKYKSHHAHKGVSPAKWIVLIIIIVVVALALYHFKGSDHGMDALDTSGLNSENAIAAANGSDYVICIDPGHGGSQCGAVADETYESTINLEIAEYLKDYLENAGLTVIMTRSSDAEVALDERADIANNSNADIFVSIHENMLENDTSTTGAETWIYSTDQADAAALASSIQSHLTDETGADDRGLKADPELAVLRLTQMPACLVECGFMSNTAELRHLTSERYQRKAAFGIAQGIVDYLSGCTDITYDVITQS